MVDKKDKKVLVSVKHLVQTFNAGKKDQVKAIQDISFDIYEGETLGLVGESGSGKTTTGRAIIRLYDPTSGEILYNGKDIAKLKNGSKQMLAFRRATQMIFQDPYASLNPRMKVKDIIAEGIDIHHLAKNNADRDHQVEQLLEEVGLNAITQLAIPMSSPVVSASGSGLPVHWPYSLSSLSPMNRSARWTFPFRRRSSTC